MKNKEALNELCKESMNKKGDVKRLKLITKQIKENSICLTI
jgi:hypothetical protein